MTETSLRQTFAKPPQLCTKRLLLRAMEPRDAADMFDYAKTELATRFLSWNPHPDLESTKRYLSAVKKRYRKGQLFDWSIVELASGKMIGTCGFTTFDLKNQCGEIGYVLNPAYWGQGLMAEAVQAILKMGFDTLGLNRIEAKYMIGNTQSRRVMEKVGMQFEGVARQSFLREGEYLDIGICAILRKEFYAMEGGLQI